MWWVKRRSGLSIFEVGTTLGIDAERVKTICLSPRMNPKSSLVSGIFNVLPIEMTTPTMEHETLLSFGGLFANSNDIQASCAVEERKIMSLMPCEVED